MVVILELKVKKTFGELLGGALGVWEVPCRPQAECMVKQLVSWL